MTGKGCLGQPNVNSSRMHIGSAVDVLAERIISVNCDQAHCVCSEKLALNH